MTSYRAAPYREPRKLPSTLQPAWRFTSMHLKSYPKFQKKELQLESSHENTRGLHVGQQGAQRTDHSMCRQCSLGGGIVSRRPLGVISPNTLCSSSANTLTSKAAVESSCGARGRNGKASSVKMLTSSLLLLSPVSGNELSSSPGQDSEGPLDIWAVIKPGNTKEKIAVYAAQQYSHGTGEPTSIGGGAPSFRTVMKVKGCWEVEGSIAKRRKWCQDRDKQQTLARRNSMTKLQSLDNGRVEHKEPVCREGDGEEGTKTLSVVEIVAYFDQQVGRAKPCSLRASGNDPLSGVGLPPPLDQPGGQNAPENRAEVGEGIRVQEMVAKLESECLKEQCEREAGGLKRSGSLRRNVGRVLLAETEARPEPTAQPNRDRGPEGPGKEPGSASTEPPSTAHRMGSTAADPLHAGGALVPGLGDGRVSRVECESCLGQRQEPLPGRLFFVTPPPSTLEQLALAPAGEEASPRDMLPSQAFPCDLVTPPSEGKGHGRADAEVEFESDGDSIGPERSHFPLRRMVSHKFLEMRFKIQLLLEPQQYMAILPHHIIVKIFGLLPTETLAALKCTCHYFKFIIESYSVRPADSRWVCDPRYKDDPCKQCKKRYGRGDVSLCRWHHKPYCQALPYGPGYWMCCHGTRKDTPGCNVGLHDNHWVPAFHSMNVPMYKKARDVEEDS
uniref:F-box protein 34 n=1 Tax=Paramormyrops kingsleyae TaxID=1676925 RepID=A0A3B3R7R0_9TELE|nr:F-box only protein 34 [Paramormyrops kingsleyae]XP_023654523.1 F-box only protein 34 [Paramormyrops kingsleyae]XP_023654524.1 F-box only protein 34 [Paramormyrops kingsleyae]XP_023654525.1 F-box only protein 34 [Paramormyrops kingsleyae]XP_023654527.1 F-box only protein 34 [Paramormyrops kingsleyae]XP_023654528.1 F-box only protein 34 [Paramormyrops kingsleyae]XP_023654529.1 F-box only protein 34 [Paramormyrops kingsleyae]